MRFFLGGLSRRPQERLHPGTTRTPQEVAPRVQGNQASPGGQKRVTARELQESLREPSGSLRKFPGASGSLRELLGASGNLPGAFGSFQELPGTFGSIREPSGAFGTFGNFRELPKASEGLCEPSGSLREFLGIPKSLRKPFGSLWEPLGASGSFWEPLGASGSLRALLGASKRFRGPPGAFGSLPKASGWNKGQAARWGHKKAAAWRTQNRSQKCEGRLSAFTFLAPVSWPENGRCFRPVFLLNPLFE